MSNLKWIRFLGQVGKKGANTCHGYSPDVFVEGRGQTRLSVLGPASRIGPAIASVPVSDGALARGARGGSARNVERSTFAREGLPRSRTLTYS